MGAGVTAATGSGSAVTDDAMLLEQAGYRVVAVPGTEGNFKITTADDLRRAEREIAEAARNPSGLAR
jgi:2-C-methyl-D-erythritol 4-phosphate cytidylyltransferase